MELACALVLLVVGSATAGPYGYGTKGGAAAKADASAVAGAYTGAGSVPLSLPSGAGYSGSFSQSSSSSSSSASSSSSSFSYSGSGALGGNGCGSGNCNAGGATGSQGSAAGSKAYSGANAGSLAGGFGGKVPTGSYGHKYGGQANEGQDCGSGGCQGTSGLGSSTESGAGIGSQSSSDAKAAASAGAGHATGADCGGSDCNNIPGADDKCVSGRCDSKAKCSSGDCGEAPHSGSFPSQYDSNKCASGQCEPGQNKDEISSIDNETDDINVQSSVSADSKSSYGANKPGCSDGNCGSSPAPGSSETSGYNKPSPDLTAPKLESPCSGFNCPISTTGYSSSSQTKAPYVSTSYQNQLGHVSSGSGDLSKPAYAYESSPSYSPLTPTGNAGCAPGTPGCGTNASPKGPLNCSSGSCSINPAAPGYDNPSSNKPSYSHGTAPIVNPSSPACAPGSPGCIPSSLPNKPSDCAYGNCGALHPVPSGAKPGYTHVTSPSFSTLNPSGSGCAPGTPGCGINPPGSGPSGYGISLGSYSHGSSLYHSSVNPASLGCSPGSPGCVTPTSASGPSGCASGSCGVSPSLTSFGDLNKPSYSHGGSPSYSSTKPSGLGCAPGTSGCDTSLTATGSSGCASGDCSVNPKELGYDSSLNIKPNYSYGSSSSYSPVKPVGSCTPGTPGCSAVPSASAAPGCTSGNCGSYPSAPGYGPSSTKPNYSQGSLPSYNPVKPVGPCVPGIPGCSAAPSASGPSDCISGNCGASYPSTPGYGGSFSVKPNFSQGSSPSYSPVKPVGLCAPGTPGCSALPSVSRPSDCVSGNCGSSYPSAPGYGGSSTVKPSYSQGFPSFSSLIPSDQACAPGSPGCAPVVSGPSGCTSGNCGTYPTSAGGSLGIKPSYDSSLSVHALVNPVGQACVPGSPGCTRPLAPSGPTGCSSGNCDEFPPIGGQGGFPSIKPSYSQGPSSYFPEKSSGPDCTPGAPGCAVTPSLSSSSGCASGNCGTYPSPQGCAPGTPGCSGSKPSSLGASGFPLGHPTAGSSILVSGAPSYGASGVGSTSHQPGYGIHGTGSLQTSFTKPSTGFPAGISGSGSYTPVFSSTPSVSSSGSSLGIAGATAGASGQHGEKENRPAYTGGFGGPAGILKPNEYALNSPPSSFGNKPTVSTPVTVKSTCVSGVCDGQASSGTASGAHATAEASASASAVAYTGGFGGPPGLLKPYDNSKTDIKGTTGVGSSLNLNHGTGGSGHLSAGSGYLNAGYGHLSGGSGGSGSAVAQAAAVSSAGASSGDKFYSGSKGGYSHGHGHDSAGGCGGGCGGSGSGGPGYSGSLGLTKTGVLDDSSHGLAAAGAVAKSVSNASSGARAFGSSYATSSASAHAGASVKGGYGRR